MESQQGTPKSPLLSREQLEHQPQPDTPPQFFPPELHQQQLQHMAEQQQQQHHQHQQHMAEQQ